MKTSIETMNKICFFPGIIISTFGSALFTFVTGLYLLDFTKSGVNFSLNISARLLPLILFSPIFGLLTDKFSKKKLLIISDILNCILFAYMSIIWKKNSNNLFLSYFGSILTASLANMVFITFQVGTPQLFSNKWLSKANSYTVMTGSFAEILSPIIGGFLYHMFEIPFIFLNISIFYLISVGFEFFLTFQNKKEKKRDLEETFFLKIKENSELLKYVLFFFILNINLSLILFTVVPFNLKVVLKVNEQIYGMIQSFLPMGMLMGSLFIGKRNKRINLYFLKGVFFIISFISFSFLCIHIYAVRSSFSLLIYGLGLFLLGTIGSSSDIVLFLYFQEELSESIRGRFIGLFIAGMKSIVLLTVLLSGILIDYFSSIVSILIGFLFSIFTYFYLVWKS